MIYNKPPFQFLKIAKIKNISLSDLETFTSGTFACNAKNNVKGCKCSVKILQHVNAICINRKRIEIFITL